MTDSLKDLDAKAAAREPLTADDAARLLACPDLVRIGMLGEAGRRARWDGQVTYGRVRLVEGAKAPAERGDAGEVRIIGTPASFDDAIAWTHIAASLANGVVVTGFSLGDLLLLAGGDHLALAGLAQALRANGLHAVAEVPLDRIGDTENAIEVVRAVVHGGLGAWRATIERAEAGDRLALIQRAVDLQRETGALRAFAPLPRVDAADTPSTGYDDVRTIALARLMAVDVPSIQVDWPLYGPKLAQVALAYGADDVDGVPVDDELQLGHRRSPREDIERQIRAAGATPVERDGRYQPLA
jgi:aminodeoxyfutalosine synthase